MLLWIWNIDSDWSQFSGKSEEAWHALVHVRRRNFVEFSHLHTEWKQSFLIHQTLKKQIKTDCRWSKFFCISITWTIFGICSNCSWELRYHLILRFAANPFLKCHISHVSLLSLFKKVHWYTYEIIISVIYLTNRIENWTIIKVHLISLKLLISIAYDTLEHWHTKFHWNLKASLWKPFKSIFK